MMYFFVLLMYSFVFYVSTPSWAALAMALAWGGFFFCNQLVWYWLENIYPYRTNVAPNPQRVRVNFALLALKEAFVGALLPLGLMALAARTQQYGLLAQLGAASWLNVCISVLAFDYLAYALHVLMHKVIYLRGIHAVHHSDDVLDASSVLRLHPLESLLRAVANSLLVVLLGLSPVAILTANAVRVVAAAWHHSAVRTPRWFENAHAWWLNTPALHRLHHARNVVLCNKNYGQIFSLWDGLHNTLYHARGRYWRGEHLTYGVPRVPVMPQTLLGLLCWPFKKRG